MASADTFKSIAYDWYNKKSTEIKYPKIIRRILDKDILPYLGSFRPTKIKPVHVDKMLSVIVNRNAPTIENDALHYVQQIFTYARKRHIVEFNSVADFDHSDAGGKEKSRSRALSRDEIKELFVAMSTTESLMQPNGLAFKILLATCVRKGELVSAKWDSIDLELGIWNLFSTKTQAAVRVPLAPAVTAWYLELKGLAGKSEHVLPARRVSKRSPHISHDTLNVALRRGIMV